MATRRKYTTERADGFWGVYALYGNRVRIPLRSDNPFGWDDETPLGVVDSDPGIKVVEVGDAPAETSPQCRGGRWDIPVPSRFVRECVDVDPDQSVAIYQEGDGFRVVPANPDPLVAQAREQGGDR